MGNHPFTMYENAFGRQFLKALNPAYKPPSRKFLAGHLLDSAYNIVKKRTDELIAAMPNINVSSDERSNVKSARICNISVHSESGSLHYLSEDIRAKQMNFTSPSDPKLMSLIGHVGQITSSNQEINLTILSAVCCSNIGIARR